MKKEWLLAMCATAMMASCAKDKTIALDNGADGTPEEIILGAGQYLSAEVEQGQPMKAASRGIGSVGDLAATNNWKGETVYVYGIAGTLTGDAQFAINGEAATAPAGTAGETVTSTLAWTATDKHYYYDGNNVYDFYGCHVDDAATEAMTIPGGTNLADKGFSVPVTINGTQDLMVAMPNKENDRTVEGVDPEVTDTKYLYSAWSSRRGVKPNLVFKHVLTRLTFKAKCGDDPAPTQPVKITSIQVMGTKNKGILTIIPVDKTAESQVFVPSQEEGDVDNFSLMQAPSDGSKTLVDFEGKEITNTGDGADAFQQIGVPMMLVPGEEYSVEINTEQDMDDSGTIEGNEEGTITKEVTIDGGFLAGTNYNINITVYGLRNIEVDATLPAWEEGGDIDIDPDDLPTPEVP